MEEVAEVDEVDEEAALERRTGRPRHPLVRSQRILQIVLGLFWILDAALQFQPYMFSKDFVPRFVLANASGQPAVIHWAITNVGNFLAPHPAVWNVLFALIQLAIGVGLLFRRTVRPALALSFPYALGVWVFGEGLGLVLTGSASPLTGAPGSVLLYALIGLMAWPRHARGHESLDGEPVGIASSAAAQGLGGTITPLAVWTGFWVLSAVLFLLPDNRTRTSISSAVTGMAPGTPGWYSHFLVSTGNHSRHREPRPHGCSPSCRSSSASARCWHAVPACSWLRGSSSLRSCGSPGRASSAASSAGRGPTRIRGRWSSSLLWR